MSFGRVPVSVGPAQPRQGGVLDATGELQVRPVEPYGRHVPALQLTGGTRQGAGHPAAHAVQQVGCRLAHPRQVGPGGQDPVVSQGPHVAGVGAVVRQGPGRGTGHGALGRRRVLRAPGEAVGDLARRGRHRGAQPGAGLLLVGHGEHHQRDRLVQLVGCRQDGERGTVAEPRLDVLPRHGHVRRVAHRLEQRLADVVPAADARLRRRELAGEAQGVDLLAGRGVQVDRDDGQRVGGHHLVGLDAATGEPADAVRRAAADEGDHQHRRRHQATPTAGRGGRTGRGRGVGMAVQVLDGGRPDVVGRVAHRGPPGSWWAVRRV